MDETELVRLFKALGNPNRLRLFEAIRASEKTEFHPHGCSLKSVVQRLSVGAPTVSHHLKELVNAGLVSTERRGKFVHCTVNDDVVEALNAYFDDR